MKKTLKGIAAMVLASSLLVGQCAFAASVPSAFSNEGTYDGVTYRFAGSSSVSTTRGGSETSAARQRPDGGFAYDVSCYVSTTFMYRELYSGVASTETGWRSANGGISVYFVTPSNVEESKSYSGVSASGSHSALLDNGSLSNSTYKGI